MAAKWKCVVLFALALLLGGCSVYQPAYKMFESPLGKDTLSRTAETDTLDARDRLRLVIETQEHSELAQRFWFRGYIANNIQKRRTTNMYDGVVIRPHGYYVNVRLVGKPFRYYKWDQHQYIWTEKGDWERIEEAQVPFDPFYGLDWWLPFMDRAVRLPDEDVLGKECEVYQIRLSAKEWLENSPSPLFADLKEQLTGIPGAASLLENSPVTTTFWIGKDFYTPEQVKELAAEKGVDAENEQELKAWIDQNRFVWDEENGRYRLHLLYQIQTWIQMPIPEAGYMDQEIKFTLFRYDDSSIKIKSPEEMERYIKKKEQQEEDQK